jgi:putative endopeptidase
MLKYSNRFFIFFLPLAASFILLSCAPKEKKVEDNGFNLNNIDSAANPSVDFYQYAVGDWLKNNPVPDAYSKWGTFDILQEKNYDILHKILDSAANYKNAKPGSIIQKIGDFFAAGMDSMKIDSEGINPIKPELDRINNISSKSDVIKEIAYQDLHIGAPLFGFSSGADAKNSKMEIAQLSQGGLGLPDIDYYLNKDSHSKEVRVKYVEHVANMFKLSGESESEAKKDADAIMKIETQLAKKSLSRVDRRDPNKTYHKMDINKLETLSPDFDWNNYFIEVGIPKPGDINVEAPDFFKEVSQVLKNTPIDQMKTYLKWNLLRSSAGFLSSDFENESFDFFGKFLNGSKAMQPRWKRIMSASDGFIGEAVGQIYVKKVFPPEAKERALKIVNNLLSAMRERINNLDWMGPETKKQALHKLDLFTVKIGYPDKWIDYSQLTLKRDSYIENAMHSAEFLAKRDIYKIGKPVDPTEWEITPQTVNAYYQPLKNEIVFPAAILQPPFFNQNADDAINYGAMGAFIGHEITHGFDDEGRQFDADGNIRDWWTKDDEKKFNERAQKIVDQFNSFIPVDSMHVNGKLTEGENIADLGGLNVAFTAFKKTDEYKKQEKIDGFTPNQRFFLAWAKAWASNIRSQNAMLRLKLDPHSPDKYRVNGPYSNLYEFWQAFNVKKGDPMRMPADKVVKIW